MLFNFFWVADNMLVTALVSIVFTFFFFNDTATTEIYTLSLHDALPIYAKKSRLRTYLRVCVDSFVSNEDKAGRRSEEHTSELQSQSNIVCRLLLEKKKNFLMLHAIIFPPIAPPTVTPMSTLPPT